MSFLRPPPPLRPLRPLLASQDWRTCCIQPHMGAITAAQFSDATDGPGEFAYIACSGMDATVRLFDLKGVIKQANKRAEEASAAATASMATGDAMPNALPSMKRAPSLTRLPSIASASTSVLASAAPFAFSMYRFDFSSSRVQQVGLCHTVRHTRDEGLVVAPPVVVPTVLQLRAAPELVKEALREMLSNTSQDWTQDSHLGTEASKYALRILRSGPGGMERCLLLAIMKAAIQPPSSPRGPRHRTGLLHLRTSFPRPTHGCAPSRRPSWTRPARRCQQPLPHHTHVLHVASTAQTIRLRASDAPPDLLRIQLRDGAVERQRDELAGI